jgi:predicted site-specific integrase-resolvase
MAVVHDTELADVIVDAGESAKNLDRPGMKRILDLVRGGEVDTVIVAKLDRLTRSVRDLSDLLEVFQRKGVSLVSVAESLDTGSAAGRLVLNIMVSVSQWERGNATRKASVPPVSESSTLRRLVRDGTLWAVRMNNGEVGLTESEVQRFLDRFENSGPL